MAELNLFCLASATQLWSREVSPAQHSSRGTEPPQGALLQTALPELLCKLLLHWVLSTLQDVLPHPASLSSVLKALMDLQHLGTSELADKPQVCWIPCTQNLACLKDAHSLDRLHLHPLARAKLCKKTTLSISFGRGQTSVEQDEMSLHAQLNTMQLCSY